MKFVPRDEVRTVNVKLHGFVVGFYGSWDLLLLNGQATSY